MAVVCFEVRDEEEHKYDATKQNVARLVGKAQASQKPKKEKSHDDVTLGVSVSLRTSWSLFASTKKRHALKSKAQRQLSPAYTQLAKKKERNHLRQEEALYLSSELVHADIKSNCLLD